MIRIALCSVVLFACAGCGSTDEPRSVPIGPPGQGLKMRLGEQDTTARSRPAPRQSAPQRQAPANRNVPLPQPQGSNPVYLDAGQARECPEIQVTGKSGREGSLQLSQRDSVTLVVCWTLKRRAGQAAAAYAQQIKDKYGGRGLEVVGLALKMQEGPDPIYGFARAAGLDYPVYQVGPGALRDLASAVGDRAVSVGFFLVDPAGRVRFYRKGFAYTASGGPRGRVVVQDSAAPGERVEDYVQRLLGPAGTQSAPPR